MTLNRREFLLGAGALALTPALARSADLAVTGETFRFVHLTDIHIEPERKANDGTIACFEKINSLQPEFCLCGGDLVFDSMEVPKARGVELYDLYGKAVSRLAMPIHTTPGNHDVLGLSTKSGVLPTDPLYGKKMFEDRIGPRNKSFDHKGWHFILIDSIGITPERGYYGLIDAEQIEWLKNDLKALGPEKPAIVMTHIPVLSAVLQIVPDSWKSQPGYLVTNSLDFLDAIKGYNVKAVLQGHTHIRENLLYDGCQYITSGAVCGNWWKGARCGHPEGFAVVTVNGETLSWRYETYGFVALPA